jgi:hypothetical protein
MYCPWRIQDVYIYFLQFYEHTNTNVISPNETSNFALDFAEHFLPHRLVDVDILNSLSSLTFRKELIKQASKQASRGKELTFINSWHHIASYSSLHWKQQEIVKYRVTINLVPILNIYLKSCQ